MKINPFIFREYDLRGVVGRDLTEEVVNTLGKGYGTYMAEMGMKDLVVGRDGRLSSPGFRDALVEGIISTGGNVTDLGVCPTPLFYFSLFQLEKEGGMMITGSHNPSEFNGFKICVGKDSIYGEEIQRFRRLVEGGRYRKGKGKCSSYEIIEPYQEWVKNDIEITRRIKVVIDPGNGTVGAVAPKLLRDLGCEVVELYCDLDGNFPNHHPDPTVSENLRDLVSQVKATGADLGIGYDGDGDRIGVVDNQGNIIWGDQLMIIFSRELLKESSGASIISEVKASQNLYNDIEKHGGRAIMWKTGHSLIKDKMKEVGAKLAGEMSGHIFFADRYFGYDDAIYASCRLLEILSRTGKEVEELLSDVPRVFNTPEIRVDCPEERKFKVVEKLKAYFREKHEVIDVDGVRVLFGDGWGLVRASNTQAMLVLRFEANTPERLQEIRAMVESKLEEVASDFAKASSDRGNSKE
jgi:phosphomannomutase/phosphoglucomutase